jgi:hypothetical protein
MSKWTVEYTYAGKSHRCVILARSASHARELHGTAWGERITHIWPTNEFGGHR